MAGIVAAGLNAAANGFAAAFPYLAIHTADPGSTGTSPSAAARVAAAWTSASSGQITSSNKAFTGGAASGPATYLGYWSASTGGTFGGSRALTGDQTFNASGQYTVTSVSETVA